ncbi:protein O-mannosyl-transferase TMTC1-like [Schistocerca gregaria]|uniref:protein O-mannosyl-transferase TMTC1-like n=1 Tax=Schistocerca gregaria TaxID=7010 RepID=UPI00211E80F8|nr:protein O-mannosyl-transferase TMTC1-like [Schistocerca gregaria]
MDGTAAACALLAAAAYYNTLDAGFVYDDRRAILGNPDVTGNETSLWRLATSDFWGTPLRLAGSHGSWRPLAVLSFRANHLLGGGWHAANAALHALCAALLVRVARRLRAAPGVAGAAFALHPAHCEAVAGLVGRADVAAAACCLLALLCYARHADLRDAADARLRRCRGCGGPVHRPQGCSLRRALAAAKGLLGSALCSASDRLSCQTRSSTHSTATGTVTMNGTAYKSGDWLGPSSKSARNDIVTESNDANNNTSTDAHACQQAPLKTSVDFDTPPSKAITAQITRITASHTTCCKQPRTSTQHYNGTVPLASWSSTEPTENDVAEGSDATRDANHNTEFVTSSPLFSMSQRRYENAFDNHLEEKVVRRSLFRAKREASGRLASNVLRRRWKKCFKDKNLITDSGEDQKRLLKTAERNTCCTAEGSNKEESHSCRNRARGGPLLQLVASVLLSACALLFKETGIAALAICVAYDVALLAERGVAGPRQLLATPASRAPRLLTRALSLSYLPAFSWLHLLLCPTALCFDWGMAAVPLLHSPLEPRAAVSAAFYVGLALAFRACLPHRIAQRAIERRRLAQQVSPVESQRRPAACPSSRTKGSRCCLLGGGADTHACADNSGSGPCGRGALLVSLSLLVVPFLPATNVARYVGFAAAERVLYLPSAGHCLLIGLGWQRLNRRSHHHHQQQHQHHHHWGWLSGFALAATLASLGARTVLRNRDWYDEESLFRSALHINPPKAYGNLGCVLSSAGRLEEAESALRQALKHRPNMADVHYNLGNLLQARGRPEEAERSYRLAIHYRPSLAAAYVSLGQLLEARGRLREASQVYEDGTQLDGERLRDPAAHLQATLRALLRLARLRAQQGDWQAAADTCRQALLRHRAAQLQGLLTQTVGPLVDEARERLVKFQQMADSSSKTPHLHTVSAATAQAGVVQPQRQRRRAAGAAGAA